MSDAAAGGVPEFRDPAGRSRLARAGLWLLGAVGILVLASNVMLLRFIGDVEAGTFATSAEIAAAAEAQDRRALILQVGYICVYIVTGTLSLMWVYRAARNARALGATGFAVRPGWAVGWYFVPIANLWKPYQAMKEIWLASSSPGTWHYGPAPGILSLWWGLWIVSGIAGRIGNRLAQRADTLEEIRTSTLVLLALTPLDLALIAVWMALIARLTALQQEQRELGSVF